MSEAHIVIETGRDGHGTVKLNGQDISRFVTGLTLRIQPGHHPIAEVRLLAPARVVCEVAEVEWVEPNSADDTFRTR